MTTLIPLEHPGVILKEEFVDALGVTAYKISQATGISQTALGEILKGKRGITASTGLKLARYFGMSDKYFVNLQTQYSVDIAKEQERDSIDRIVPLRRPSEGECCEQLEA